MAMSIGQNLFEKINNQNTSLLLLLMGNVVCLFSPIINATGVDYPTR